MKINSNSTTEQMRKDIMRLLDKIERLEAEVERLKSKERKEEEQDKRRQPAPFWDYNVLTAGKIAIAKPSGLRQQSPNGQWWRIDISDLGVITTTNIANPYD